MSPARLLRHFPRPRRNVDTWTQHPRVFLGNSRFPSPVSAQVMKLRLRAVSESVSVFFNKHTRLREALFSARRVQVPPLVSSPHRAQHHVAAAAVTGRKVSCSALPRVNGCTAVALHSASELQRGYETEGWLHCRTFCRSFVSVQLNFLFFLAKQKAKVWDIWCLLYELLLF